MSWWEKSYDYETFQMEKILREDVKILTKIIKEKYANQDQLTHDDFSKAEEIEKKMSLLFPEDD